MRTAYTSGLSQEKEGNDDHNLRFADGKKKSRLRMSSAIRYFQATTHSRGFKDVDVVKEMEALLAKRESLKTVVAVMDSVPGPLAKSLIIETQ